MGGPGRSKAVPALAAFIRMRIPADQRHDKAGTALLRALEPVQWHSGWKPERTCWKPVLPLFLLLITNN